ncbi:MAG: Uma2 family endonuclease, partial [Candidatus Competibacter sp.]
DHRFEVVPDWVCEILSPSTAREDRLVKMPVYARYGVPHLWLVDPLARSMEAFALEQGRWVVIGLYGDQETANIPPFQELDLQLAELWAEG